MTLSFFPAAFALTLAALIVALCLGKQQRRAVQRFGIGFACTTPLLSLTCDGSLTRGSLAVAGVLIALRALDLHRDPERYGLAFRWWFLGAIFDGRKITRGRPRIEWQLVGRCAAFLALSLGCLWLIHTQPPRDSAGAWLIRWSVGAVLSYAVLDFFAPLLCIVYAALGVRVDTLHRAPILSRTVQEFWGERWNRPVHEILTRYFFVPFARRRQPRLGVFMAFVGSAALHFWMMFAAVGVRPAAVMGAFFLLHGAIVLLERRLRVARWREPWGRVWTVGWFLLTVPLFVEPGLQMLEL